MKVYRWRGGIAPLSLKLAQDKNEWSMSHTGRFNLGEPTHPRPYCIADREGPRGSSDVSGKRNISFPSGIRILGNRGVEKTS
jgi:hypothetical protein